MSYTHCFNFVYLFFIQNIIYFFISLLIFNTKRNATIPSPTTEANNGSSVGETIGPCNHSLDIRPAVESRGNLLGNFVSLTTSARRDTVLAKSFGSSCRERVLCIKYIIVTGAVLLISTIFHLSLSISILGYDIFW